MEDFHSGDMAAWFDELVSESKDMLSNQKNHMGKLKPGINVGQSRLPSSKVPMPAPPSSELKGFSKVNKASDMKTSKKNSSMKDIKKS